jgi:hypothetical protein
MRGVRTFTSARLTSTRPCLPRGAQRHRPRQSSPQCSGGCSLAGHKGSGRLEGPQGEARHTGPSPVFAAVCRGVHPFSLRWFGSMRPSARRSSTFRLLPLVRRNPQRRIPILVAVVWIDAAVREEELDISAPSPAALDRKHVCPPCVSCMDVQARRVRDQLHGVLVDRFILRVEGKSKSRPPTRRATLRSC